MATMLLALHYEGANNGLSLLVCEEDLAGSCDDPLLRVTWRGLGSWFRLVDRRGWTEHSRWDPSVNT
jgi:hypothetical protein